MNFNLSEYSKSMRQLLVFDVLIKEEVVNNILHILLFSDINVLDFFDTRKPDKLH